jgi:hypothetical protein
MTSQQKPRYTFKKVNKKAEKWERLVQWIKDTHDSDEDRDDSIWDFLGDELGVETNGNESDEPLCKRCCAECGERLNHHVETMNYCNYITNNKIKMCSTCYWNEGWYESDSNEDNKQEILEFIEVKKKLYPNQTSYFSRDSDSDDEQYKQLCPDCDIELGKDVGIMCYNSDKENLTLCYNCYWDNEYYKTDSNEDNQEEIQEYLEGQKQEEEMDLNTKFGLMFIAKSVIEERTGTKLN